MESLFCKKELYDYIELRKDQIISEINSYDKNQLLNSSLYDLADYIEDKFSINIPELLKNEITVSQQETKIDISNRVGYLPVRYGGNQYADGIKVIVKIPYKGNSSYFSYKPSTYRTVFPYAHIMSNYLQLEFSDVQFTSEQLKNNIDHEIENIEFFLNSLRKDATDFNRNIRTFISTKLENRKNKLLEADNLVANLGFKLEENTTVSKTFSVPIKKQIICPISNNTDPYMPEPALDNETYNKILMTLQSMSLVIERSPETFKNMDEEAIRTLFLVNLNAQFQGQATGETFNCNGKTDILIRVNDKNIFIGECKFWKGEKKYIETIDQILGYTSWRDTKTAILIFNKNKETSKVIETIKQATIQHKNYKRKLNQENEQELKYVFGHNSDMNRELILSVLIFDLPD